MVLKTPKGRLPRKQIAFSPVLADSLRHVARIEQRQLSDVFREMFEVWLDSRRQGQYLDVRKELQKQAPSRVGA